MTNLDKIATVTNNLVDLSTELEMIGRCGEEPPTEQDLIKWSDMLNENIMVLRGIFKAEKITE
jgi:hypothetical protein